MSEISVVELLEILTDGEEFALLDVRERARYATGHLFLAINLPLSRLELNVRRYVPRPDARVVLCDNGEGVAQRAAAKLEKAGYTALTILRGGVSAWREAGQELFRGHYATTYAFGLYVAEQYATPAITAVEVENLMHNGKRMVIVDGRPADEVSHGTLPGAYAVPFSELPYRFRDLVTDDETPVVVHCGAVTRGVLGAETLREAGIKNPLVMVTNGARGWEQAGFELERGSTRTQTGAPSRSAREWARSASAALRSEVAVKFISARELEQLAGDPSRTLYLVDVRSPEEYAAGHRPGSISVVGSEMVGLYEDHIGTLNARVCLVDDDGVRASVVASWLTRMGWPDVMVLERALEDVTLEQGAEPRSVIGLQGAEIESVEVETLAAERARGEVAVVDFSTSGQFRQAHIPGSWWISRAHLAETVDLLPCVEHLVANADDADLARLAAIDLARQTGKPVRALAGGTDAWLASGRARAEGASRMLGPVDDVPMEFHTEPGDDDATRMAAHRRNREWQQSLLAKIERDQSFSFPTLPPR